MKSNNSPPALASARPTERPTIDVQISSAITELHDELLTYRGRDAAELARTCSFEQVAELLWTGELPASQPAWPVDRAALEQVRAVLAAAGPVDHLTAMTLAATWLGRSGSEPRFTCRSASLVGDRPEPARRATER